MSKKCIWIQMSIWMAIKYSTELTRYPFSSLKEALLMAVTTSGHFLPIIRLWIWLMFTVQRKSTQIFTIEKNTHTKKTFETLFGWSWSPEPVYSDIIVSSFSSSSCQNVAEYQRAKRGKYSIDTCTGSQKAFKWIKYQSSPSLNNNKDSNYHLDCSREKCGAWLDVTC